MTALRTVGIITRFDARSGRAVPALSDALKELLETERHVADARERAYSRGVTGLGFRRRRAAFVLALVLLWWVAASRSSAEHPVVHSSPPEAGAIESLPTLLVTTSDRPVLSLHARLVEGQRALWVMAVSVPAIGAPASVLASVRPSPSILAAGPVAQGLAGRGPPLSTNA
jgi:hypothetical protein